MGIVVFAGCCTSLDGLYGKSLPKVVVEKGARSAIGFEKRIMPYDANKWVEQFAMNLNSGFTIEEAREEADNFDEYEDENIRSSKSFGQTNWFLGE